MGSLEPWQRYRKASPCPICSGYGAYKPENRCKGFLSADGEGAFCSAVADGRSPVWFEALGLNLYWHPVHTYNGAYPFEGEGESKAGRHRSRILWLSHQAALRHAARQREARRPPTAKDFG
jgi:hypothetical protein